MAQQEKWQPFIDLNNNNAAAAAAAADDDEEEALSLSDLPDNLSDDADDNNKKATSHTPHSPNSTTTDFEFRVSFGGCGRDSAAAADSAASYASAAAAAAFAADMCAADEVFFRGQLLPLRPSLSSSSDASSSLLFRSGSLPDSLDRSASSAGRSSRSSSGCVSRSHSSNGGGGGGGGGGGDAPPRLSASGANYFLYTFPSPSPQIRRRGGPGAPARRSTSSHAPGIFRLGVARAPDIELRDLRMRARQSHADAGRDARRAPGKSNKEGGSFRLLFPSSNGDEQKVVAGRRSTRTSFIGRGFGCSCAPDAVEPVSSLMPIAAPSRKAAGSTAKTKKEEEEEEERRRVEEEEGGRGLKRGESMCRRRILEWLEELSIGKVVVG